MKEKCLITITALLSSTNMPYNDFLLYRRKNYQTEKQVIIVLFDKSIDNDVEYHDDIVLHRVGFDIVLLHKVVINIVNECKRNNMKYIFHIHEAKSVIFFNIATAFKYVNKIVYTVHSTYINYNIRNKLFSWLSSNMCRDIVCVSKTSYKYFPRELKIMYGDRIKYIQNGVDNERINSVKICRHKDSVFRLVYVARLVSLKNHKMLLSLVPKIENTEIYFIGDGKLKAKLMALAAEYKISDRVHWCGKMSRNEVYQMLGTMDCYVSSSKWEGLPISVLEAMSSGLPCIVSDIEQHREVKERCEELILASSTKDWIDSIILLRDHSEWREKIGLSNKKRVAEHFSLKSMHDAYDNLYWSK